MLFEQLFNILTFYYYGLLQNFCDFLVFVYWYRAQNENPDITENLYFLGYKAQMNVDLFFITILTFSVLKLT